MKGASVIKPIINDKLVAVTASTPLLKIFFARTAVIVVITTDAKTRRFPSKPLKLPPFLKTGSIIVIKVPARAMSNPILSFLVTCSFRKKIPAITIVIGAMAEIKFESTELVLLVPRNKRPKLTVERRNPFRIKKISVFLSLGSFKPKKIKKNKAIMLEIKKRYVKNTPGEKPPKVNLITGAATPQIKETIRSSI